MRHAIWVRLDWNDHGDRLICDDADCRVSGAARPPTLTGKGSLQPTEVTSTQNWKRNNTFSTGNPSSLDNTPCQNTTDALPLANHISFVSAADSTCLITDTSQHNKERPYQIASQVEQGRAGSPEMRAVHAAQEQGPNPAALNSQALHRQKHKVIHGRRNRFSVPHWQCLQKFGT